MSKKMKRIKITISTIIATLTFVLSVNIIGAMAYSNLENELVTYGTNEVVKFYDSNGYNTPIPLESANEYGMPVNEDSRFEDGISYKIPKYNGSYDGLLMQTYYYDESYWTIEKQGAPISIETLVSTDTLFIDKAGVRSNTTMVHDMPGAVMFVLYYDNLAITDTVPVIGGQTAFITNVAMPMSETEIRSHISAYDNEDGNVTSSIILVSDNYTPNKNTLGTWIINYSVSDSSGNTSLLEVNVLVKDVTKPVIVGTNSYTQSMTTLKNIDLIKNGLSATDNYDATVSVLLKTDNYSTNYNIPGAYTLIFKATDTSSNEGNYTVTVNVVDDVKPTISGPTTILKGQTETLTTASIKADMVANDNLDGNITSSIVIISDDYTGNANKVGVYNIVFGVTDASGNTIQKTVTVTVADNIAPVYYVDNYFIKIDRSLTITHDEIIQLLTVNNQIVVTSQTSVTATYNEYQGNESEIGMYGITYLVSSVDGNESEISVVVEVTSTDGADIILDPVDTSVSWWQAILNFFIWIWDNIFVKSFNWVTDLF